MKYLYFFIFLILFSCNTTKKTYICGDHPCLDKQEFKEYFAENLVLEIESKKSKKDTSIDLVQLNSLKKTSNNAENKILLPENNELSSKEKKKLIKVQKANLKKERKRKKIEDKNRIKNEKKLAKLKKKNKKIKESLNQNKTIEKIKLFNKSNTKTLATKTTKKMPKKNEPFQSTISKSYTNICEKIENCDIDKIAELLINEGKTKDFPDITSKKNE